MRDPKLPSNACFGSGKGAHSGVLGTLCKSAAASLALRCLSRSFGEAGVLNGKLVAISPRCSCSGDGGVGLRRCGERVTERGEIPGSMLSASLAGLKPGLRTGVRGVKGVRGDSCASPLPAVLGRPPGVGVGSGVPIKPVGVEGLPTETEAEIGPVEIGEGVAEISIDGGPG